MKTLPLVLALAIFGGSVCVAEDKVVTLTGVKDARQIIGYLGKPLGTVVQIQATVRIEPDPREEPHPKEQVVRCLAIDHVDGKKLDSPVELEIWSGDLRDAKNGQVVNVRGFERIMTLGTPPGVPLPAKVALRAGQRRDYQLMQFFDVAEPERPEPEPRTKAGLPELPDPRQK